MRAGARGSSQGLEDQPGRTLEAAASSWDWCRPGFPDCIYCGCFSWGLPVPPGRPSLSGPEFPRNELTRLSPAVIPKGPRMESGAKPRKVPEVREGEITQSCLFLRSCGRDVACGVCSTPSTCCCLGCWEEGEKCGVPSSPGEAWGPYESLLCKCPDGIARLNTGLRLDWNLR